VGIGTAAVMAVIQAVLEEDLAVSAVVLAAAAVRVGVGNLLTNAKNPKLKYYKIQNKSQCQNPKTVRVLDLGFWIYLVVLVVFGFGI